MKFCDSFILLLSKKMSKRVSFGNALSSKRKTRSGSHNEPLQSILRSPANKENSSPNTVGQIHDDGIKVILAPRRMEFDSDDENYVSSRIPSQPKKTTILKRRATTAPDAKPLSREVMQLLKNQASMKIKETPQTPTKRERKPTVKYQASPPKKSRKTTVAKMNKSAQPDLQKSSTPVEKNIPTASRNLKRQNVSAPLPEVQISPLLQTATICRQHPLDQSVLFTPLSKARQHTIGDNIVYDQLAPNVGIITLKGKKGSKQ